MITSQKKLQRGVLAGLRVAFTGKLLSMPRERAHAIVKEAGGSVTTSVSRRTHVLIVGMGGWPLLPTGEVSSVLRRAEDLNSRGARIRIISEEEFLEEVGLKERGPALEKRYTAEEICDLTGIDRTKLRRWEQLGLIRGSEGCFDFQDLISLRTLTELLERGVRPETIHRSLRGLASILPGTDRPLAQLQVVQARSGELMAELDGCTVTAEGQFILDFDTTASKSFLDKDSPCRQAPIDPPAARTGLAFRKAPPTGAASWLEQARTFEESEEYEAAANAYRSAIACNSASPDAFFGLGNVLRALERPDAALEMFRIVVALDPTTAEAWYNIADIQEERDDIEEAIASLKQAIAACPGFADAYYNLALCFERLGQRTDARRCWTDYLRLDPASHWAEVARDRLNVAW